MVAAEEHVLPVVHAFRRRGIGERGGTSAERRPRLEHGHAYTAFRERGRRAQSGESAAEAAGEVDADAANNARLIGDLAHLPPAQRTAHYYCVLVLLRAHDDPQPVIADASWHGEVIDTPHGRGGFGYDPHFLIPELGCTVAELDPAEKNRLGHRGQAMRALVERLDRFAVVADATQGP